MSKVVLREEPFPWHTGVDPEEGGGGEDYCLVGVRSGWKGRGIKDPVSCDGGIYGKEGEAGGLGLPHS